MTILKSFTKSTTEVATYTIDWDDSIEDFLGSDTISSSSWSVLPAGLTIDSDSETTTVTTVIVSSGTVNTAYTLTNQIVTVAGSTWERQIVVYIGTETATEDEYFTYDLATDVGLVRFWTRDVVEAKALWSDAEIDYMLTEKTSESSPVKAAVITLLVLKLNEFENPEYVADWLEEREMLEAAQVLGLRLKELRKEFGISQITATAKKIYRDDSLQLAAPDYSDGADDAVMSETT